MSTKTNSAPHHEDGSNNFLNSTSKEKDLIEDGDAGVTDDIVEVDGGEGRAACETYKIRWVILILFVMYSMSNAFQWIQYSIIGDIIEAHYGVSPKWVDMTSMVYMICYIPLIFPATFLLEKKGLRFCVILGSLGTCLGSWIKVFSTQPSSFAVSFIGQTVVAVSQIFVLGIPPLLASLWFPPTQVSTATSIGVFGNQLGVAAGFLLPPIFVRNNGTVEETSSDLKTMFLGTGVVTTVLFGLVLIIFKDRPPKPPSLAQAALQSMTASGESYVKSIKSLLTNVGYLFLLASYGMNVGVFYAISTLLNPFVLKYFPGASEDAGRIGVCIVFAGMAGSILSGLVLDKTKRYKETTVVIYLLSLVGMIVYTFSLQHVGHVLALYFIFAGLGFFMTGYLPVGFEFAAEITYPESEGTSSGLLNASAQIFGIALTPMTRALFDSELGDLGANLGLCIILAVGLGMTILIKANLKRTNAQRASTSYATGSKTSDVVPLP